MSAEDWSPSNLPAVSYIRVAPATTDAAAREVERQRAQIALAAQRLGLQMADEFVDVGYSGLSMDRPDLRRLLHYLAVHRVGFCVVGTRDLPPTILAGRDAVVDVEALAGVKLASPADGAVGLGNRQVRGNQQPRHVLDSHQAQLRHRAHSHGGIERRRAVMPAHP